MKKVLMLLLPFVLLALAFAFIIIDRDRSMWVLNTAIKSLNPRTLVADVAYGENPWQQLDIYPAPNTSGPAPVLVFIHGGGWYHGRKDQYFFAADAFLRLGYTVVLPNYIKHPAPEAHFPAHIVDAAKAVAWVKNNIAAYNGDPDTIFIAGHSAGAHTAALLATDSSYIEAEGLSREDLRGFAGIAGPYKFIPDTRASMSVFGPESNYARMNPLRYIDGNEPATLLLHSDADRQIAKRHPREFASAIKAARGDVETIIYESLSHADMVTHLHPWFAGNDTIANEIDRFFRSRSQSHSSATAQAF